jgi:hypothetical protein
VGLQSQAQPGGLLLTSSHELAQKLLRHLAGLDDLASRTLRLDFRDDAATFFVDIAGERVPLFRTTPHQHGLLLSVWKDPRWQPTPERGDPEALAELLAGPLRFVWFLDAEDAADPVADL